MPIILPEGLASAAMLQREGIETLQRPPRHSSPLLVGLLNLMPDMTRAEMQFARLLGVAGRHVELLLALPPSYRPGYEGTGRYARWGATSLPRRLDGSIVTGAPLEHLPFEDVTYWRELTYISDWAASNVGSTLYICWAAFAALHSFHRVRTRVLPQKISGVFQQQVMETREQLTVGLGASLPCPVSRHTEVQVHDVPWRRGLTCLAQSSESGLCLVADAPHNAHYMFNHLEYDADTLKLEYLRDRARRADTALPQNYLPNGDVSKAPPLVWRRPAERLFANWLAILAARRCAHLAGSAAEPRHHPRERYGALP
jgi:homoserine O-succinyltransferase/O-acetyltransferase